MTVLEPISIEMQGLYCLFGMLIVLFWCYILICSLQLRVYRRQNLLIVLATMLSYLFYTLLRLNAAVLPPVVTMGSLFLQAAVLTVTAIFLQIQGREHLTAMSVKEAFDSLPSGLCYYRENGMILLINPKMEEIYRTLTGRRLSNAAEFAEELKRGSYQNSISGEDQPVLSLPGGRAYSFTMNTCEFEGETIGELIAADVTKTFQLTRELEEKQKHIRQINARLKALNSTIRYVIMEKELLALKTKIHDDLGQALLQARRAVQDPESMDAEKILSSWKNTFGLLLHEQRESWQTPYLVGSKRAELMGIQLICAGELPEEEHLIKVIDSAITVHTSNVMRHAEGSHAYILVEDLEDYYLLHFTNDGNPPRKGIRENGGLANLRRMAEQIGGGMKVVALPRFELLLKLPKKKPEDEYGVFSIDC